MASSDTFAEFVATRSPRLQRTAYLLTHDWAQAEDLLQMALVRAWGAWGRIDGDPEPYVRKVLVNVYASWWRRRWRHVEQPMSQLPEPPTVDHISRVDRRDEVWQALGRLPRRQRAVLVLRYFEDMTEAQIADAMSISVGTVKSQAKKALEKLRLDESLTLEAAYR
ncbi:SigE family RNA polymerase sigma factor [Micromonospora avicenniae]|uniref:RNA polymerase sigma-70 factor, sigma-E family n=1 Tax=Micromonospora avicenniae TaxID=1198245 RepID=A0A1N6QAV7_9ACTN|nr:SigE family RNA polymerase sigma factor [Micromonospora avicenniae]SIQ13763.1 RNA polymerase sigma-70 factor, sigma-E family [Micromonospora avicenniae]